MSNLGQYISGRDEYVCSFDVFDTILTRTVTPPSAIFFLAGLRVSQSLPDNCSPLQFAYLRRQAEEQATAWKGASVSLDDIYTELQSSLHLSDSRVSRLRNAELAVEEECLYPVPDTCQEVARLRNRGASIVFTSDMYLPGNVIKGWLRKYDVWDSGDRLFVSCEHGCTKRRGRLFYPVKQEYNNDEIVFHAGNSVDADVDGAEAAGIPSCHVKKANPNRYEQVLEGYSTETRGFSARLAGASRYARLQTPVESEHEKALRKVAAGVMAPILVGFVSWILRRARERNIDCLYFTSRDGYHLLPIARRLRSVVGVDCDVEYLYLSRAALAATDLNPAKVESTWSHYERPSGEELLVRLGLEFDDIEGYLSSEEEKKAIMSDPITDRGKKAIQRVINLIDKNREVNKEKEKFLSYISKKGLGRDRNFGLVDIGWKGSVHMIFNDVLIKEGVLSNPAEGLFFGLSADQQSYAGHRRAYFFDEHRSVGVKDPLPRGSITRVMEMFCTAPHGTVTGYKEEDGQTTPSLESSWADRMEDWGFPVVERTLHSFLDGFLQSRNSGVAQTDVRRALSDLLQAFWMDPSPSEAAAWGAFPMELGQGEGHVRSLAEPYDELKAPFVFLRYGRDATEDIKHGRSWLEGSLAQTSPWLRRSIRFALHIRKTLKYVFFGVAEKLGVTDRLGRLVMKWGGKPTSS